MPSTLFCKRQDSLALLLFVQISLISLDILGVLLLTAVAGIGVSAIRGTEFPLWVNTLIKLLNLESFNSVTLASMFGILAGLFFVAKSIFSFYLMYRSQGFLANVEARVTQESIQFFFKRNFASIQNYSLQQYQHSLTSGINSITSGVIGQTISIIAEVVMQFAMTFTLFFFSPMLTSSIFLIFIGLFLFLNKIQGTKARALGEEITRFEVKSLMSISDIVQGYREILVSGRLQNFLFDFSNSRLQSIKLSVKKNSLVQVSKYVFEVSFVLVGLWIAAFSFYIYPAEKAASLIVVFLAAASRISTSILRLQYGYFLLKGYQGSTSLIFEMFEKFRLEDTKSFEDKTWDSFDGIAPQSERAVSLSKVTYKYPGNSQPSLREISFEIFPNESIALVGPSGGGKSTIADMILGVIDPDSGERKIFGYEPRELFGIDRNGIAYVPQQVYLQSATIAENIALGYPMSDIDFKRLEIAIDKAHLSNFIQELPDKTSTIIGQNGFNLSGGQRQRIGIARALYRNPKLLVLDEATSALDAEMEEAINQTIEELRNTITTVVIAHRLSTVKHCGRLLYIDDGVVKASGTFNELRELVPNFDIQANLMGIKNSK